MNEEKFTEKTTEVLSEKKEFVAWVKKHKVQLLLVGVSITTLLITILGLKNKDTINKFWCSLKKEIEKGAQYSEKWFKKASLDELEAAREVVQKDYLNPKLDLDYRNKCWILLKRFDNAIGNIKWQGKEYGYPVHSENGWHLPSSD